MPSFLQIVESTQRLCPSKWHSDIHHFSEGIEISPEKANGFIGCAENSGIGQKADGSWKSNPEPYGLNINPTSHTDNILNLHYKDTGDISSTSFPCEDPSPTILDQPSRHVFVGKISSQNKSITINKQPTTQVTQEFGIYSIESMTACVSNEKLYMKM